MQIEVGIAVQQMSGLLLNEGSFTSIGSCSSFIGSKIPALPLVFAGPCMWAPINGPERLSKTIFQLNVLLSVSKVNVAMPVAGRSFGGTSLAPLNSAFNDIISAEAIEVETEKTAHKIHGNKLR